MSDAAEEFLRHLERIDASHAQMADMFDRLLADPPRAVVVGDRVVVAAGLVGRGHLWIRAEAEVIDRGDVSVKVRFARTRFNGEADETWIHPALITDVLR